MRRRQRLQSLSALAVLLLCGTAFYALYDNRPVRNVSVVFSQGAPHVSYKAFLETLRKEFAKSDIHANITTHYLDCESYARHQELERAKNILQQVEVEDKPHLIISVGDQATYSLLETGKDIVRNTPFVFTGVIYPNEPLIKRDGNVTGFRDSIDIVRNIHLAKSLVGRMCTYTMLDQTFLDKKTRDNINYQLSKRKDIINNLDWVMTVQQAIALSSERYSMSPYSMRDMRFNCITTSDGEKLKGQANLIEATRYYNDMAYIQTKFDAVAMAMIRLNIYRPQLTAIFNGFGIPDSRFIGGYFASAETLAKEAVTTSLKILHGTKPKDIPVSISEKGYYLDWQVAKTYNYDISTLPEGFTIVNYPWTERYPGAYHGLVALGWVVIFSVFVYLLRTMLKERRQKRKALAKLEHEQIMYNMAVQNSNTFAWEREGTAITFADVFWEFFEMTAHTVTVKEFARLVHPDHRQRYLDGVEYVDKGNFFNDMFLIDLTGEGEYHWWQIRAKGIIDDDGKPQKSYGMLLNVDAIKEREAELIEARRMAEEATMKESFLANISHEIRTPLNAIVGFSNLLAQPDETFSQEDKETFIEAINTNNELLLKLVNDILEISSIESGQTDFVMKRYSVNEIVKRLYVSFEHQVPDALEFVIEMQGDDERILVDDNRLCQIMNNFLSNAVKFTTSGSIRIGWRCLLSSEKVELYVEDTGIGMSESELKMIFSRFYKKDSYCQGTGLGLSISQEIAKRMGGKIIATSTEGKGSRFSVVFPVA